MNKKLISLVLTTAMTASCYSTAFARPVQSKANNRGMIVESKEKLKELQISENITKSILEQGVKDLNSDEYVELLVVSDGTDIVDDLENIGACVNQTSTSVYVINIEANNARSLAEISAITAVGRDKLLHLPEPTLREIDGNKGEEIVSPNMEYGHEIVGMSDFWGKSYDGKGTKVAIIDTGVEPANEMLTSTTDGKIKIVDYKDFYRRSGRPNDGDINLEEKTVEIEDGKKYIEVGTEKLYLPESVGDKVLFGIFDEELIDYEDDYGDVYDNDINNNGKVEDKFSVIVTDYADRDKGNDKIFVDTDIDSDLSDENEMGIYREVAKTFEDDVIFEIVDNKPVLKEEFKENYNKLVNHVENKGTGKNAEGTQFNFVVTEIENSNSQWSINLAFDGNGHGTHVAGDAAGNGYKKVPFMNTELKNSDGNQITDGTVKGSAPGAQVIALRVFKSTGGTPTSAYLAAMEYACENDADVVNMSLGGLPDINDYNSPGALLADQLSKEYGTIFCMSAGNNGPVSNSVGQPGTSKWAISSGAYAATFINYGSKDVPGGLHEFSSRGPSEDGRIKPTIVSPGDMISAAPIWQQNTIRPFENGGGAYVGYNHMQGTSMASPYTAGVVAALKQAINENDLPFHPLVVKEALVETGDKTLRDNLYKVSEIGGGMIQPVKALEYLEDLKAKGLTQERLENEDGYVNRNDLILKTEFDYSETLDYKPEGLYVRSEEIPNTVDVTITNTKNVDLNLDLVKDSYAYSNSWLKLTQDKLSLKAGESKTLTLVIDDSKLNKGMNSALIKMDDESTPLKEGVIPVSVVNYSKLSLNDPVVIERESREMRPGDWNTHFINIPKGVNKVEVTIELTNPKDGGVYILALAKPSGVKMKNVAPGHIWGRGREGYSGKVTFEINDPIPGTWELGISSYKSLKKFVSYGMISQEAYDAANGKHKITAKIKDVAFEPGLIKYSGKAGEYIEHDFNLKVLNASNNDNKEVTIKATNLAGENTNKKESKETIKDQEHQYFNFTIDENDPNIFAKLATRNVSGANDDLDIELHKVHEDGTSTKIESSALGGSDETIYVQALAPGNYFLDVFAYQTEPTATYDLIMQIANDSHGEKCVTVKNSKVDFNQTIENIEVGVKIPDNEGEYFGFIYAVDGDGNTLGKAKIEAGAFEDEVIIDKSSFPTEFIVGEAQDITLFVSNNQSHVNQSVTLIVGIYDKDTNKLVKYHKVCKRIEGNTTEELTISDVTVEKDNQLVRCFVWNNLNGMNPLTEMIEIPVK